MLIRFPILYIPNGVDSEALAPLDPSQYKYALGIPERKKVIIFCSDKSSAANLFLFPSRAESFGQVINPAGIWRNKTTS